MADSVFKLVVDSKEYDSKIQRATSGLMAFEKKCREVGGTLEYVEKEDIDFVKALGKIKVHYIVCLHNYIVERDKIKRIVNVLHKVKNKYFNVLFTSDL